MLAQSSVCVGTGDASIAILASTIILRDTVPLGVDQIQISGIWGIAHFVALAVRSDQQGLQMGMDCHCFVDDFGLRGYDGIRFYIS